MQIHLLTFLKAVFQVCKSPENVSLEESRQVLKTAMRTLDLLVFWNQGKLNRIIGPDINIAIIKTYWSFL